MSFLIWKIKVYSEAVIYFWTKRGSISNSYRACLNNLPQPIFVGTRTVEGVGLSRVSRLD